MFGRYFGRFKYNNVMQSKNYLYITSHIKVKESQYKQCGVTPHFSIGQNILKKTLEKDKY